MNYNHYVRAKSADEAYELYQKKNNRIMGGMLWLKMQGKSRDTMIDLCDLGLNTIEETEDSIRIGAYVSLRTLETDQRLNKLTNGAFSEAMKHIVGVQFRNTATVGGSIWGRFGYSDVLTLFYALDTKVVLHHAGTLTMEQFLALDRSTRDLLLALEIPKNPAKVVYLSQRNVSTDFPTLTCAVSKDENGVRAIIGARPHLAACVADETGILANGITAESAAAFGAYVASKLTFGTNSRAGALYRSKVCEVLVRRALLQMEG